MSDAPTYYSTTPNLLPLYARALRPGRGSPTRDIELPALSASLLGAHTATRNLHRYSQLCGFPDSRYLPITWPHIMAFSLQMKVLTERDFPLPLLGLVHLENTIMQHRQIGVGEPLDIHVHLGGQTRTHRGIEFELRTDAIASGDKVWEETSVILYRLPAEKGGKPSGDKTRPALPNYPHQQRIVAPADTGRQYARVSGDSNPIHLYALTAKAFGFPKAIAHGMWSKARALATLQAQAEWQDGPMRVNCKFRKPVLLPGQAILNWQTGSDEWPFQLLNEKGDAPHLTGSIEWL
ncbi:MaoC family dehydratase [Marinobacter sp. F4216]|uniref:MaoC family dehydratase n=1 Tax=Marinobacter sp. F4216 TaxID=2874281 RepID=UPI001CBC0645|nr:MaoC/PaaZ C-terminal domain-containing protein [Marinobacter sp. F4216]MBZ2167525.1 hypothetical protein [Marinobacter sp. F4216]